MKGLEPVKSTRIQSEETPEIDIEFPPSSKVPDTAVNPISKSVSDNFTEILNLAGKVIELKQMKVQSDAVLAQMEAERQRLIAETDAYCRRKESDNARYLGKLDKIRLIMADYNKCGKDAPLSEEAFCSIITQIINSEE